MTSPLGGRPCRSGRYPAQEWTTVAFGLGMIFCCAYRRVSGTPTRSTRNRPGCRGWHPSCRCRYPNLSPVVRRRQAIRIPDQSTDGSKASPRPTRSLTGVRSHNPWPDSSLHYRGSIRVMTKNQASTTSWAPRSIGRARNPPGPQQLPPRGHNGHDGSTETSVPTIYSPATAD
jgi:hypothetical protein